MYEGHSRALWALFKIKDFKVKSDSVKYLVSFEFPFFPSTGGCDFETLKLGRTDGFTTTNPCRRI